MGRACASFIPNIAIGFIWMGFGLCRLPRLFMLSARVRALPGGASLANNADRSVWQGVAIGIMAVVLGVILRGIVSNDMTAANAIMAAGFGMYGIALFTTGCVSRPKWLRDVRLDRVGRQHRALVFSRRSWAYLVAAGASVVVLIIPGVIMLRREPSTMV